jgi:hypothetical protein
MTKKKHSEKQSTPPVKKDEPVLPETSSDEKPGFPERDFRKNLGCG